MEESPVVVVMVPLPAHGHLNSLLNLSMVVASKGIPVHYTGYPVHNRQARQRVNGWDPSTISNIHFHDFALPPFPNTPPDPNSSNKFPSHFEPTVEASLHFREPVSKLLNSFSSTARRVVVVHDILVSFIAEVAFSVPNCEAYGLRCVSAFSTFFLEWEALGKPKSIPLPTDLPDLSAQGIISKRFDKFITQQLRCLEFVAGELLNTCRPIEGAFIELLAHEKILGNKRRWDIGPLHPVAIDTNKGSRRHHRCLDWLDKQPLDSVLYISFGTQTSVSDEQINELAIGLKHSGQRFIWVLRDADRGDIYAECQERKFKLPDGYEERLEGQGMIVRDWAPQLEILAHPSIGGFLSHCGWNSCMESMSMGVPIAAWPMHSDQPMNSVLVTHVLKIGLTVREWESREEVVSSSVIESSLRKLMVSEEGNGMRRRAKELGVAVRQAVSEGGSSTMELDSFISHISR